MNFILKYKYTQNWYFFLRHKENSWHFQSENLWSAIQVSEKIIESVDQTTKGYFVLHQVIHIKTKEELQCGM